MRIHLISIGGAVMHNLALALKESGHNVSGSDDEVYEPSKSRLNEAGLLPAEFGWKADRISTDLDLVIIGMHARKDNPELQRALDLGLKVQSFPEFIYEHAKDKKRVVIGGSHGKTTTTAMIMHALKILNADFDYLVGSQLEGFKTMVRLSDAPVMVIEGDEYLTSAIDRKPKFHWYKPQIAVLTGIAWDHINVFGTFKEYVDQFAIFASELSDDAVLYYFGGDENLQKIVEGIKATSHPYFSLPHKTINGLTTVTINGQSYDFEVYGEHMLQNMMAAYKVCVELGYDEDTVLKALSTFKGTAKRLEKIYDENGVVIIRDFAHSPSKVKASTDAVRTLYPDRQLIALFELHTFSSLNRDFIPHYKNTLAPADEALVYFDPEVIEHKRLTPIEPEFVQDSFRNVEVFTNADKLFARAKELNSKDKKTVYLVMSSGTFSGSDPYQLAAGT